MGQIPGLTALNVYRLVGPPEDFVAATRALAARVEAEGHPGVLGYRFFVDAGQGVGRAVVDYADADAWIGHHDLCMGWPEMRALHAAARLEQVTFLGPVPEAIRHWLARSTLTATLHQGFLSATGFVR